jgi:hypothetical protein
MSVPLVRCEREYVSIQLMSKGAREILSCTKSQGRCDSDNGKETKKIPLSSRTGNSDRWEAT